MRSNKIMFAVGLAATVAVVPPALAVPFDYGSVTGAWDTQVTVGVGVRTENPSCNLTGDPTSAGCGSNANTNVWSAGDNGNLNYKKGQLFTGYMKGTSELLVRAPDQGVDFMARGSYLFDPAAQNTDRTKLYSEAENQIVNNFQLYDLWLGKSFDVDGHDGRVRIGNQVINWGESLFLYGGINATNAIDFQKSLIPGTQIKEYVLPAPMVSVAGNVAHGVNVEGYYQFYWNYNRYPPVGSYWSTADFFDRGNRDIVTFNTANFNQTGLDPAAILRQQGATGSISRAQLQAIEQQIVAGTVPGVVGAPVLANKNPGDQGQYGISVHIKPSESVVDIGLYYLRYHDKAPVLSLVGDPNASAGVDYQASFRKDRDLFGISANFPLGNWAIGSEFSYRPRDAVSLSGCFTPGQPLDANVNANPVAGGSCSLWKDLQKYEAHLTGLLQLTPSDNPTVINALQADTAFLSVELVGVDYPGVNQHGMTQTVNGVPVVQLPQAGYITWLNSNGSPKGVGTALSGGGIVDFNWTYDGTAIPGWQVTPGVTYFRALFGDTPTFSAPYLRGAQSLNFYLLFNQNPSVWQAGLNLSMFFGGNDPSVQPYRDRDFVGAFVTRNF